MDSQSIKRNKSFLNIILVFVALLMAAIIFIIDINVPVGIAIGTAYAIIILYSWSLPGIISTVMVAVSCTILVVFGYLWSPESTDAGQFGGINRLISVFIIWLCASLVAIAKQGYSELEEAKNTLEQKVLDRTSALKQSEQRIRSMVEDIQNYAILLLSPEGIIENWNRGAEQIKGYSADEIIGESFKKFHTPEAQMQQIPQKLLRQAAREGRAQDEGWRVKKDGSLFFASVTITPIFDEQHEVIGFSELTRDLTERKKIEEMELAQAILKAKNEELAQFAYIASHDLQEPLVTLKGYISLVKDDYLTDLDEEGHYLLETIDSAINRMSSLIRDLLDYSRIGKGKNLSEVGIHEIIGVVQKDLGVRIKSTQSEINIDHLPDEKIKVYPTEFRQIIQNLISNGIKFQPKDNRPVISISATKEDAFWRFSVKDNGIGIDEGQQQKIFEIFKRLHSKSDYEGTGIGLATCRKIAELHGGKIWIESKKGEGSTFHFTIAC